MSVREYWSIQWIRRALILLVVLALLAPVFGVAAEGVGYTEPIEVAADETGASGSADPVISSPLPDYSMPGLPGPIGTLASALLGSAVVLVSMLALSRPLAREQ